MPPNRCDPKAPSAMPTATELTERSVFKNISPRASFLKDVRRRGAQRFFRLRHANATALLAAGVHPRIVAERLGHANIMLTMNTYSHVLPGIQEPAVDAIRSMFKNAKTGKAKSAGRSAPPTTPPKETSPTSSAKKSGKNGSGCWTRTSDPLINSQRFPTLTKRIFAILRDSHAT